MSRSRVLITAQLRLFLWMTLLHPCWRDYQPFMIRHDKDLYKHNQNFMDGNKGFFIAHLGGGFKYFLFSPLLGEMIQFD